MDIQNIAPAAGIGVNSMQEIKSHSSILYNQRLAILWYMLDMKGIDMNTSYSVQHILEFRANLKQIYKNMRMLIRYNPVMRATLNLETQMDGSYTTDIAVGLIDKMIESCEIQGYTTKRIYIIVNELNKIEMLLKDIMQYFHYFIRPDFRQKPDIEMATEKYKEIADSHTIEELKQIVGKSHQIDFEGLGSTRVELDHSKFQLEDDSEEENFDSTVGKKGYTQGTEFEVEEDE